MRSPAPAALAMLAVVCLGAGALRAPRVVAMAQGCQDCQVEPWDEELYYDQGVRIEANPDYSGPVTVAAELVENDDGHCIPGQQPATCVPEKECDVDGKVTMTAFGGADICVQNPDPIPRSCGEAVCGEGTWQPNPPESQTHTCCCFHWVGAQQLFCCRSTTGVQAVIDLWPMDTACGNSDSRFVNVWDGVFGAGGQLAVTVKFAYTCRPCPQPAIE